ncbi:hypothetical protein MVEN_01342300 [Mycena venus]|uniref:Uncharacterized protein n=1 Tax=Mycena venus TaxID=2733690 RepID=A0A8H6Y252_9AGAR|nr:hypothetical protein MVEN_01342300 [Mycena venus]
MHFALQAQIVLLAMLDLLAGHVSAQECNANSDCAANECCRTDLLSEPPGTMTCHPLLIEGQICGDLVSPLLFSCPYQKGAAGEECLEIEVGMVELASELIERLKSIMARSMEPAKLEKINDCALFVDRGDRPALGHKHREAEGYAVW